MSEVRAATGTGIETRPLKGDVGAEVLNVDITKPLSDSVAQDLYDLWLDRGVLLFRGQPLTPERHLSFSRLFGELELHPLEELRVPGNPEVVEFNHQDEKRYPVHYFNGEPVIGLLYWHTDLIYAAKPNRGAALRALELPPENGRTGFGDQALAYDHLSDAMKERIEGLEVVYRFDVNYRRMKFLRLEGFEPGPNTPDKPSDAGLPDFPDAIYPLVYAHPENGRKILNVCPMFLHHVVDMDEQESDRLLQELADHVTSDEFTYIHSWEPDDLVLWDNWRMMHCATGTYPNARRRMQRTTIAGDVQLGRTAE